MPDKSRWTCTIPEVSLPTFVFGSSTSPLPAGNALALIDANRPDTHYLTLSDFRLWSKRVAVGLQKAGLKEGDRVLLFSGNNLFFPALVMGVLMAGGVFTGANPTYVARELAHQLKDSEAKFLLSADGSLETALEGAKSVGFPKERIYIFDDEAFEGTGMSRLGAKNWKELVASQPEGERFEWKEPKNPKDTLCCLNYSSGTTGVAKGVMITHYNHIANASQVLYLHTLRANDAERKKKERFLCCLPVSSLPVFSIQY